MWITLLSAMFMHGGWLHLIGNMLFLFVFGNNVEDAMSRSAFLLFYLLGGLAASITQFAIDTASEVPNIGASGAIAGVLGGYVLLHPRARVLTAIPLLVFIYLAELPAVLVLLDLVRAAGAGRVGGPRQPGRVVRRGLLRAHRRLRRRVRARAAVRVADTRPPQTRRRALRVNDEARVVEPRVRAERRDGSLQARAAREVLDVEQPRHQVARDAVRARAARPGEGDLMARGSVQPSTPRRIDGVPCSSDQIEHRPMCGERLKISAAMPHM